ncbi:TetR family transcriptional regulator [Deinococcus yavapaiensis]|uniref:TetR family transcriptional regulator n=1 Tax=Deinococcus yavapaiensis KR-236 TaxID=694435 RepID=A0A318SR79_9DEIO|nr:TetR family transcriptional regulator [Deinococcus yavapaiensis]PYE55433.1 TetR family transcriptional regulator [Deinococcus yavapaiensis KR-236]
MSLPPNDDLPSKRPTGRRRGDSGARQAILDAAREQFAAKGYTAATVRDIAAAARVDPALIRHYFGSKDDLFAATLHIPPDLVQTATAVLAGDPATIGERFARAYLGIWEDPVTAAPVRAIFRTAVTTDKAADLLREFLQSRVLREVAPALGTDRPEMRAILASTHLLGIAIARFVLHVEPLASLDREELVAILAPTIQHYLTAPLPSRS